MLQTLGRLIILIHDYDAALTFYRDILGFQLIVDMTNAEGQRFVHVGLPGQPGVGVWFLEATTAEQRDRVGNQTGGEPCFVAYTDDVQSTYRDLQSKGVKFRGPPHEDAEAAFVHCYDLYGNEIVLVQLKRT